MEETKISVQGKGAIHVVPDVTRLEVTIEQWFADYGKAFAQAKENSAWMVKILEYNKKPGKLAKTVRFNIEDYTENEYDDDDHYIGKKKNGFMLEQRIKIDLPIDNYLVNCIVRGVGKFIPSAQINIGYTLQDERPSQLKMLARAVSDAREKAKIIVIRTYTLCRRRETFTRTLRQKHLHPVLSTLRPTILLFPIRWM